MDSCDSPENQMSPDSNIKTEPKTCSLCRGVVLNQGECVQHHMKDLWGPEAGNCLYGYLYLLMIHISPVSFNLLSVNVKSWRFPWTTQTQDTVWKELSNIYSSPESHDSHQFIAVVSLA